MSRADIKSNLILESAHSSKQGVRPSLEDRLIDMGNFQVPHSKCTSGHHALYAVFDGHGNEKVAKACVDYYPDILTKSLQSFDKIDQALHESILKLDEIILKNEDSKQAGAVTVIALIDIEENKLWVANVGDSRCIIISQNGKHDEFTEESLSIDHRPESNELKRIKKAGGFVNKKGYVMNVLAITRCIGDGDVKKINPNVIINTPDLQYRLLNEDDKYLILGCDGLWDVMTNEQVEKYLISYVIQNPQTSLRQISEQLTKDAINKYQSTDNVSVIIVKLHELSQNIREN